jgi:hypothetical protein
MHFKDSGHMNIARNVLLILSGVLWAIWIQPHTLAARNLIIIVGSVLGIYVIVGYAQKLVTISLTNKGLWALVCILLLIVWVIAHYVFFSRNPDLQWRELTSIWKRIVLAIPFAIAAGFSLAVRRGSQYSNLSIKTDWPTLIMTAALCIPTVLFLIRYGITHNPNWEHFPNSLKLLNPPSSWYIPKTGYVFFCLPVLALALVNLIQVLKQNFFASKKTYRQVFINLTIVLAVIIVFYLGNIKNGMAYSFILILIGVFFGIKTILKIKKTHTNQIVKKNGYIFMAMIILFAIILLAITHHHLDKNDSWKTLLADTKVALQTDRYDHWKYYGQKGYPQNEFGKTVSITNYERIAWAKVAISFVDNYPLGYGLVLESYRYIAQEIYTDSKLLQSHSAWLDLLLGLGIPGVCLLGLAATLTLISLLSMKDHNHYFNSKIAWFLSSMLLCMLTTEVAQKVYIDALIFCIIFSASYCIMSQALSASNPINLNKSNIA